MYISFKKVDSFVNISKLTINKMLQEKLNFYNYDELNETDESDELDKYRIEEVEELEYDEDKEEY